MGVYDLRILIIDDSPTIHNDLIEILKISHEEELLRPENTTTNIINSKYVIREFIIDTALDSTEGLRKIELAKKQNKNYALAFVNITSAGQTDGIEQIRQMWEVDHEIQIVISTSYPDYNWDQVANVLGMGDNYLILKSPLDTVTLRQLVYALTRKWSLTREAKRQMEIIHQTVEERTHSLQHSISLLRSTIESSADGILVLDLKQKIIDYNNKFLGIWGIPDSVSSQKDLKQFVKYMSQQLLPSKGHSMAGSSLFSNERLKFNCKNGQIIECNSQPHRLNNKIIGTIWSYRDITERANLEQKLEFQASHDMLTGLPNRLIVMDRVKNAIDRARRTKKGVAVLFIDLDRFKLVNDSLNHTTGDSLLCLIADRLSALVRKEDTLARLGGDEFIMIIPDLDRDELSVNIAAKILKSFKDAFPIAGHQITMSPSIGISVYPTDGKNADELLKNADLAMYQAKGRGGNQFQFYTKALNEQSNQRFEIETQLNHALANNEFVLVYQPLFDINNEKLLAIEALLRWNHPQRGCLSPIHFMRIAEESGLIIPIGEWVIREVCAQMKSWRQQKIKPQSIAVNIALQQLKQVNFADTVRKILNKYKVNPKYLEFEITENIVMTHLDIIQMINQLTSLGIKIVLDDFGIGKSSLNYLKHIHIDRLKIDPSYINNISRSRSDEVFIEAIIAMSRSFNFKVLAEGVELPNQISYLKEQHCDQVQGFLLSQPLSALSIEQFLKNYPSKIQRTRKN